MPEFWAKLLFTYGPFALLVFFVFVLEKKARLQRNEGPDGARIYLCTWCAIFVIAGIIICAWCFLNLPGKEVIIKGRLTGLQANWDLRSPSADIYIRRIYDTHSRFDFAWCLFTRTKPSAEDTVELMIDRSSPDHEDLTTYELPIRADLYNINRELLLVYSPQERTIVIGRGNNAVRLREVKLTLTSSVRRPSQRRTWAAFMTVHAQQTPSLDGITVRLEANDALVRVAARTELARAGGSALPLIQRVLTDPKSSYRLRLGVIWALNNMTGLSSSSLSAAANCTILRAANDTDAAIRGESEKYVSAHLEAFRSNNCTAAADVPKNPRDDPPNYQDFAQTCAAAPVSAQLGLRELVPVSIGGKHLYLYLAGISASDDADIFVFSGGAWSGGNRKISKGDFNASLRQLGQQSYSQRKTRRFNSFTVRLDRTVYIVHVVETHYFNHYAVLAVCQPATTPT